jgi:hypothetical protein
MNVLCRLGLHKWDLWLPSELMELINNGWEWERARKCVRCGDTQVAVTRKVEGL